MHGGAGDLVAARRAVPPQTVQPVAAPPVVGPTLEQNPMAIDHSHHHRRSIRLRGYDYAQPGMYFVTICTHDGVYVFADVIAGQMRLNAFGEIAREEWFRSAEIRPHLELLDDEYVVMPDHVHGIIRIANDDDGGARRGDDVRAPHGNDVGDGAATV
jgi:hypothetical protein